MLHHAGYRPQPLAAHPRRVRRYIANPKGNGYKSLHTVIVGPEDKGVEVQIRTFDMHQFNEFGVAAHWRYKEGGKGDSAYEQKIAWLRQLLDWRENMAESGKEDLAAASKPSFSTIRFTS